MKRKLNVKALLRKQVDKDAAVILKKVDLMLKQHKPNKQIEKAVVEMLSAYTANQLRILLREHVAVDYD